MGSTPATVLGQRVGDRLVAERRVTKPAAEQMVQEAVASGLRLGESLPSSGQGAEGEHLHRRLARHAVACLGDILIERGLIGADELGAALKEQAEEAKKGHWLLLGEILDQWGLTTREQLDGALLKLSRHNEVEHFRWKYHPSVTSPIKRFIDVAGALVGLGLTLTVLPWVALAIYLEDGGPVLFRQNRVGLHGWQFPIWKFRTMVPDADRLKLSVVSDSALFFNAKEDSRITRVGRILRKTMLDEFPQFWNVLLGQMSLVGTRPPTLDEVRHYATPHWQRLAVKPGLTGLWQACGDRHAKTFEDVLALDVEYQEHWSVATDLLVIAKTVYLALARVGRT